MQSCLDRVLFCRDRNRSPEDSLSAGSAFFSGKWCQVKKVNEIFIQTSVIISVGKMSRRFSSAVNNGLMLLSSIKLMSKSPSWLAEASRIVHRRAMARLSLLVVSLRKLFVLIFFSEGHSLFSRYVCKKAVLCTSSIRFSAYEYRLSCSWG